MNFKTTIALIVLLAAAGAALFFTREKSPTGTGDTGAVSTDATGKLLDIDSKDVTVVTIAPTDGPAMTMKKSGADWLVTDPVTAPADTYEVEALVRALTDATTRGQIDPGGANAAATGLASPRYHVTLTTASKTVKFAVGEKSAVGDTLYVQLDGKSMADLIPATDLSDKLAKGVDNYRKKELVSTPSDQITQVSVTHADGSKLSLKRTGTDWQVTAPTTMPADSSAASDLTYAITGLRADSFVDPKHVPATALAHPQLTVTYSGTTPATPTTIIFGSYDDILKKNVYSTVVGSNSVAKVPATSLDSFKKKPLELRDKKIVNIDPEQVSKLTVTSTQSATTQPTTRPASNKFVALSRRKIDHTLGPVLPVATTVPTTRPTTGPVATTKPVEPPSKWVIDGTVAADDAKVTKLLGDLHPLTADKYRDPLPTTRPVDTYVLTITTTGPGGSPVVDHVLTLIDPGSDQPLIGTYDGLTFDVARTITADLSTEFKK
jgi:hypothetical protein